MQDRPQALVAAGPIFPAYNVHHHVVMRVDDRHALPDHGHVCGHHFGCDTIRGGIRQ